MAFLVYDKPFIRLKPNREEIAHAQRLSEEFGVLNNSIRGGEGNFDGALGEVMVAYWLRAAIARTYEYDLLFWSPQKGRLLKIDVKTKTRTVPLNGQLHDASVSDYNPDQQCDCYFFASVQRLSGSNGPQGIIAVDLGGIIPKASFYEQAEKRLQGSRDPKAVPGHDFKYHCDCWNLAYEKLITPPQNRIAAATKVPVIV